MATVPVSAATEFAPGDKVKLTVDVLGSAEKAIVYGNADKRPLNRQAMTLPKGTEVFIKKTEDRNLSRTSTAGPGASLSRDYSCEKNLNTKYRLVQDTDETIVDHRIPHTSLSRTEGGPVDQSKTFVSNDYAHVIKAFTYKTKEGSQTVKVNEVVKIYGGPRTSTGKELSTTTAFPTMAHYGFVKTVMPERKVACWKSDGFHPASAYEKI